MSASTVSLRRYLIVGVLALAACRDTAGPRDAGPGSEASPAPAVVSQEPEGEQAALARAVPGFGGLFLDESGAPTVYLTDPGQRLSAQRALVGIPSQYGSTPPRCRSARVSSPGDNWRAGSARPRRAPWRSEAWSTPTSTRRATG